MSLTIVEKDQNFVKTSLIGTLKKCSSIGSIDELKDFFRTDLESIIPSKMVIFGIVELNSLKIISISNIGFPEDFQ